MPIELVKKPELSQKDVALAATNDPSMSDIVATIGGKQYPIVYLPYKDQMLFLALLAPLLQSVAGRMAGIDSELTAAALLTSCAEVLPPLAAIVCRQSDPAVTAESIVEGETSPFELAGAVVKQLNRNNLVQQVAAFFQQIGPLLALKKTAR
jgi:phage tail sheath gpL-like